jgi:hypothetical protein
MMLLVGVTESSSILHNVSRIALPHVTLGTVLPMRECHVGLQFWGPFE